MAEIPVEKKSSIWPWILLALAVLAALLLFFALADEPDEPAAIAAQSADQTSVADIDADAEMTLAAILANPQEFIGRDDFDGEVDVPTVPTDRGFWVEHEGAQMFALLIDGPQEVPLDINPGQDLRITGGIIRDADNLDDLPGEPIDDDTRAIMAEQEVFLLVDEDQIEILSR